MNLERMTNREIKENIRETLELFRTNRFSDKAKTQLEQIEKLRQELYTRRVKKVKNERVRYSKSVYFGSQRV